MPLLIARQLFVLPAYSPELNPDEQVRNDVENSAVGHSRLENSADLHRTLLGRLRYLQKTPERVRSFFQLLETRCAA